MKSLFKNKFKSTKDEDSQMKVQQQILNGPPELKAEDILFSEEDLIGKGSYGTVYRGNILGLDCAVKVPNKRHLTEKELAAFQAEINIMRGVFHPYSVLFLGACTQPGKIMICTELMCFDLEQFIYKRQTLPVEIQQIDFSEEFKLKIAMEMVIAVNWLHNVVGIVHRDLKPANFMFDHNMTIKVCDYGFSIFPRDAQKQNGWKGSPLYIPQEVFVRNNVTFKADVYAMSYILWQCFTEKPLFDEYKTLEDFSRDVICGDKRPKINSQIPTDFAPMMKLMWHKDYQQRPTMREVLTKLQIVSLITAIFDKKAREFWLDNFYNVTTKQLKTEVKRKEFFDAIKSFTNTEYDVEDELGAFVPYEVVTVKQFGILNQLFPDFYCDVQVMLEVSDIVNANYYAGDISREKVNGFLHGRPDGYFLARLSPKTPTTPLIISCNVEGVDRHFRVTREITGNEVIYKMNSIYGTIIEGRNMIELINKACKEGIIKKVCPQTHSKAEYV